ncbi:hypothetical protein Moror_8644 [Moniliophthora roreri MCA 2997]|uniref:Uncharacterized protein n=1 Tax=Moniliophthora roreri (strain MCA 2997) TaxID=1381753 RepID=V2YD73_MONRO|nr:hypothetical protein Moror_8644 [Moniliophthora roreri MCA 2997]
MRRVRRNMFGSVRMEGDSVDSETLGLFCGKISPGSCEMSTTKPKLNIVTSSRSSRLGGLFRSSSDSKTFSSSITDGTWGNFCPMYL